jgi:putative ABC transport system substrate-binding protein
MKPIYFKLRSFLVLVCLTSLLITACTTQSQPSRMITIGIINYTPALETTVSGFKDGMTDAGYIEGKSIQYVYNGVVKNDKDIIDQEIQKVLAQNPDLFLSVGSPVTVRIKDVLDKSNKAAVFAPVTNPEKLGLVADIRKPGGRMTGINTGGAVTAKGLEWLLHVASGIKRVHVYYLANDVTAPTQFADLQKTADQFKVELLLNKVESSKEAFAALPSLEKGLDAVLLIPASVFVGTQQAEYLKAAVEHGIPVGSTTFAGAPANQLTGLVNQSNQTGRLAARLAEQILLGADPGTLPVLTTQYSKAINLVTAKALGLTISDSLLLEAENIVRVNPTPQPTPTAGSSGATPQATSSR